MALRQMEQPAFRELNPGRASGKSPAFVSEQGGNYEQSAELLARNGMRMLTYREAFSLAPEIIKELKGKMFYLDGKGAPTEFGVYTYTADGELAKITGKEKSEQRVRVFAIDERATLYTYFDSAINWRFDLRGDYPPERVSDVVVGVKINPEMERTGISFKGITGREEKTMNDSLAGLPESTNKVLFGALCEELKFALKESARGSDPESVDVGLYLRSQRARD